MDSIETRQYGGSYRPCGTCKVLWPPDKLTLDLCSKCAPKPLCRFCLVEDTSINGLELDMLGYCVNKKACSERYWRCETRAAEMENDAILRDQLNQLDEPDYTHHNEACDYQDGQWTCPEPCGVSDPPLRTE